MLTDDLVGWVKATARGVLGTERLERARRFAVLQHGERVVYMGRLVRRLVGSVAAEPKEPRAILFVCFGNIIRSPMAAEVFRQRTRALNEAPEVLSAGLAAVPDRPADARAVAAAAELGFSLIAHRAQPLTRALVDRADLVVVMDHWNEAMLLARFPDARHKVRLLGSFDASGPRRREIADPYTGSADDIRACYQMVVRCTDALVTQVTRSAATTA